MNQQGEFATTDVSAFNGSRRERRRRRTRRRLVPVGVLVVVGAVAVGWVALTPRGTSSATGTSSTTHAPNTTTTLPIWKPPTIKLAASPAMLNEGRWIAKDMWHKGTPLVFTTYFRTNAHDATTIAYAAWMRTSATRLGLYLGYEGPGATNKPRGPEMIPQSGRQNLLAAFNSGFYEKDSAEGFYSHNRLYFPMIKGHATLVEYTNGTLDIVNWTGGPTPAANVLMARQNLHMLLTNSIVSPATANGANWGITLHGVPAVWRTALGIDAHGNLIYLAASNQTAVTLARAMRRVGAVRAMQLDINPEWPIYVTYAHPGAIGPRLFVPNPNQVAGRFLYTSTKDFFALYKRVPGQIQTPW